MNNDYKAKNYKGIWITGNYTYDVEYPDSFSSHRINDFKIDEKQIGQYIGMKDIHGNKIYSDVDIVKFKYRELCDFDQTIDLTGTFCYDEVELRYQIDIIYDPRHPQYLCLNYMDNQMSDFEIIGSI